MLNDIIASVQPLDINSMEKCQIRIDNLTKPLNSLGGLEKLARQMSGIIGHRPKELKKSIILMAADHGVAYENVSSYPQEVTAQMVKNFCNGGAAINVFAKHVSANLMLVDIGVAADLPLYPNLRREKIAYGTNNIANGAAMTREQAVQAIETGIKVVTEEIDQGVQVIGLGEMGIANTTPSTAIIAAYSSKTVEELTGRGAGLSDDLLEKKRQVIQAALSINKPDCNDPLDVLSKVGGLEIAGLVGVIIGAAANRAVVVLDGLITGAAALIACKMAPIVKDFIIGSHYSVEPAHKVALELIEIPAYLQLDMRLGEGTGAVLGMSLINASLHMLNDMKTFGEAEVAVAQDGPGALKQNKDIKD